MCFMFVSLTASPRVAILSPVNHLPTNMNPTLAGKGTLVNLCAVGILDGLDKALENVFGDKSCVIITDETVWKAVASRFAVFLRKKPDTIFHILPGTPQPYASDQLVDQIRAFLETVGDRIPLAVGSGTINDVVKRASFELGMGYACVPTAPSVDGFTAYGAAITVHGFKQTLECPAPRCVVADEDILRQAPLPLVSAGFADLLAKLSAGADWILADELGIEPIDPAAWNIAQPAARGLLGKGPLVFARDSRAISALYQGLIASGLAMQSYEDSRPASGAEHLFAHTWEMSHLEKDGQAISHGFKVALGTLISTALAQELFGKNGSLRQLVDKREFAPALDLRETRLSAAKALLAGSPYYDKTIDMIVGKTPSATALASRVQGARKSWETIAARYAEQIPPFETLKADLRAGGCPTEPMEIGLSREACVKSLKIASLIRNRYTILDLVSELGILDEAAEAIFAEPWFSMYEA